MLICDGHVHIYPRYDLGYALDCLIGNLAGFVSITEHPPVLVACLTERAGYYVFTGADYPLRVGRYEIFRGPDAAALTVRRNGDPVLFLLLGRQYVSRERIEVLGLAMPGSPELDGIPAREIIRSVSDAGGLPVLPWAPGKWLARRGRLVSELIENNSSDRILLGDTTLRPSSCPLPPLLRRGRARGLVCIPGSDALPLPGEERRLGSYGFGWDGEFDSERPASAFRELLVGHADEIRVVGRRGGWLTTAYRIGFNYLAPRRT